MAFESTNTARTANDVTSNDVTSSGASLSPLQIAVNKWIAQNPDLARSQFGENPDPMAVANFISQWYKNGETPDATDAAILNAAQVQPAAPSMLDAYPDLSSAYQAALKTTPGLSVHDFLVNWANTNPTDPRLSDTKFLSSVGLEVDPGTDLPAEQALLNYTLGQGQADVLADQQRKQVAADLLAKYNPVFDGARNTIAGIYDGSLLKSEYGANDEAAASQQAALATQMGQRRAAFDKAISDIYAAQDPLNQARLDATRSQGTAVNLAAQAERDRVLANFARDGYVGGSTGTDAALFRASLAGRQGAAQAMGDAKVANATDLSGIGKYAATEGRSLADYGAGEQRNISDSAAQRKLGFFSNDIARRLSSLSLPTTALQTEFNVRNAADNYGQSGYSRLMQNLGYFRTNGGNAPTQQVYTQQANDAWGNTLNSVGAGITGLAGNALLGYGKSNNWWSSPKTGGSGVTSDVTSTIPSLDW